MFEWDSKIGTMLEGTLRIISIGQSIADPNKKTWVLDPAANTFEEKIPRAKGDPPAFATEDVLLDARGDLDLPPELHPDLGLKAEKNRKDVKVGMLPEALVVTALGQLRTLDPQSESDEEQSWEKRVKDERKYYEYLKNAPKDPDNKQDSIYQKLMKGDDAGAPKGAHGGGAKPAAKGGKKKKSANSASGGMSSLMPPPGVSAPARGGRGR